MDSTKTQTPTSDDKASLVAQFADDIKAENIETLSLRHKSSVTDYFVICSGNSDTHVNSIVGRVEEKMRELGHRAVASSERQGSGWVILDFGDVVFHCMKEEQRQFYDLEALWNSIQPNPDLP